MQDDAKMNCEDRKYSLRQIEFEERRVKPFRNFSKCSKFSVPVLFCTKFTQSFETNLNTTGESPTESDRSHLTTLATSYSFVSLQYFSSSLSSVLCTRTMRST